MQFTGMFWAKYFCLPPPSPPLHPSETEYVKRLQTAADNFIAAASKLPRGEKGSPSFISLHTKAHVRTLLLLCLWLSLISCFTPLQMFSTIKEFCAFLTVFLVNCQSFVFAATCIPPCGQYPLSGPNGSILSNQPSDLSVRLGRFPGWRHNLQLHHLQVWLLWVPSGLSRWVTTSLLSYPVHPYITMIHPF